MTTGINTPIMPVGMPTYTPDLHPKEQAYREPKAAPRIQHSKMQQQQEEI